MAVTAYTKDGTDAAIQAAVEAVELTPGPQGEPGRDGAAVLALAAGEDVPEGVPAGTLIVRVIA